MATSHRLFFALQPQERARKRIGQHRDGLSGVTRAVADARLHLTLAATADFADFPADLAHALHRLGASVAAEPVAVSLGKLAAAPESVALRPAGRNTRELRALHRALAEPMARGDLLKPAFRFNPHVTLAYRAGGQSFVQPIEAIAWESHEFVLIHSEVGATRHCPLGRWPLYWRQGRLF